MTPPVTNLRRTAGGRSNGTYQPGESAPPSYIPMQHLELAGIRRSVLVALVIAFLIPVGVGVWALSQLGASSSKTTAGHPRAGHGTPHAAMAMNYRQSPLFKTLVAVDASDYAKGLLPPSSCKAMSATMVSCTQPRAAIDRVSFQTFTSTKALYAAYVARVTALAQGPFRANFGNCTENMENGERGWNHEFRHPGIYPLGLFISGQIKDEQAAGRLYCTLNSGILYLVWTQDDGRLLGELAGAPHLDAYLWWHNVHHELAFPGTPNMMQSMSGMQSTTSTRTSSQSMPAMSATTSTRTSSQRMPSTKAKHTSKSMSGKQK